MATGHNTLSVVEELSSPAFCKIAAPVSPRRGYPELPYLSGNPRPYSLSVKDTRDVSKTFGEWYQKTNKTEDTN
jgi:hypothetical protein